MQRLKSLFSSAERARRREEEGKKVEQDEKVKRAVNKLEQKYQIPPWAAAKLQTLVERNQRQKTEREQLNDKKEEILKMFKSTHSVITGKELREGDCPFPFAKIQPATIAISKKPALQPTRKTAQPSKAPKKISASTKSVRGKSPSSVKGSAKGAKGAKPNAKSTRKSATKTPKAKETPKQQQKRADESSIRIQETDSTSAQDTSTSTDSLSIDSDTDNSEFFGNASFQLLDILESLARTDSKISDNESGREVAWNHWAPLKELEDKDETHFTDEKVSAKTLHSTLETQPNNQDRIPGPLLKPKRHGSIQFNNIVHGQMFTADDNFQNTVFKETIDYGPQGRPQRR